MREPKTHNRVTEGEQARVKISLWGIVNRNNRVIVITDGQPTAYFEGEHLHVELSMDFFGLSPNVTKATLAEIRKVTAQGMNIETFMLDDSPVLVEFTIQALTQLPGCSGCGV